jgi:flavin-dependent dehydrogenase
MSKRHDYVVIGAGPAGSVFATLAAREGRDVCLIERKQFPRDRVGESITFDCNARLQRLQLPSPEALPHWRIATMRVFYESGHRYTAKFPAELQHFLLRRAPFDDALLQEAKRAGASLYDGNVSELLVEGDNAVGVRLRGGEEIRADRLVVAAGGREVGFLRRHVEYKADSALQIFGGRVFCKKVYEIERDQVELYVNGRDIAIITPMNNGEDWAVFVLLHEPVHFEKSEKRESDGKSSQERAFRGFLSRFKALSQTLSQVEFEPSIEFHSQMASYAERISLQRLALIGNAFGYSDPLLSHGVDYAVEAAERLSACLRRPDTQSSIDKLHKAMRRLLWLDVRLHRLSYEVFWSEKLYAKILPDGQTVSGVRMGEKAMQWVWRLAAL